MVLIAAACAALAACRVPEAQDVPRPAEPPVPSVEEPALPLPPAAQETSAPPATPWVLTWEDDFDGAGSFNTNKWEALQWLRGNNPNGPDGWWKWDDAYLDGEGHLVLRVKRIPNGNDDDDPYDYAEGAVRTKGLFAQRFGKFEIRCTTPAHPGWWAAFWLMPAVGQRADGSGRDGSEIDIMEVFGANEDVNHALHWDGYGPEHKSEAFRSSQPGIKEGFHTFTLEWYDNLYIFYVDGKETWQSTAGGVSQVPAYVKVTAELETVDWAIQTNWAGNPADGTFPDYLVVDWVRVYTFADPTKTSFLGPSPALERDRRLMEKPVLEIPRAVHPISVPAGEGDWAGIPATPIDPTGGSCRAEFRYAWDDEYLYVRADVADDVPMVNPHSNGDLWKGDGVEVTLTTDPDADPRRTVFGPSDFQIGFSPGDLAGGLGPSMWIWRLDRPPAGSRISSMRTRDGYRIEAALAWKELNGFAPRAGLVLGFDFAVDDADDAQDRKAQSVWFGEGSFYRNPYVWGTMKLVE